MDTARPQLVGPRAEKKRAAREDSRGQHTAIPYDLLQAASRRLGIASLLAASLWVVGSILYHLASPATPHEVPSLFDLRITDIVALSCVIISLALFDYTRRKQQTPKFVLDLGLGYMVLTSFALGLISHWEHVASGSPIRPSIGWTGVVVLVFAAIVPSAPVKILIAGTIAVSMNPLSMLIANARGAGEFGPVSDALLMRFPDYLLVGAAVVIAHVVTSLGREVSKARDMGSYRLVRMLGKGGAGEVWQASHRMLLRDAAIKLIQPDLLSRATEKSAALMKLRFEQEARATALLRSPHTVELYDFGVTEAGVFYYVMELLDGMDLSTLVKTYGPQPPARVIHILRQVCRSLADAHSHQLVHRDIKPTNIFLCRMGNEYDFAKVLDFGLVKSLDSRDGPSSAEALRVGTPAYMAPEVILGRTDIDSRCDLYGLGCVAYWLLTGELVFEERESKALMAAHVHNVPIPPSRRSGRPVPSLLERLVLACLAKEPADRPESAVAIAHALADWNGADCDGAAGWTADDAERWWLSCLPASHPPSNAKSELSTVTQHLTLWNPNA